MLVFGKSFSRCAAIQILISLLGFIPVHRKNEVRHHMRPVDNGFPPLLFFTADIVIAMVHHSRPVRVINQAAENPQAAPPAKIIALSQVMTGAFVSPVSTSSSSGIFRKLRRRRA